MEPDKKHKYINWREISTNLKISVICIVTFFIPGAMIIHSEKIAKITNIPTSGIVKLAMFITIIASLAYLFFSPINFDED